MYFTGFPPSMDNVDLRQAVLLRQPPIAISELQQNSLRSSVSTFRELHHSLFMETEQFPEKLEFGSTLGHLVYGFVMFCALC
jgi:hypothetical protein